MGAGDDDVTIRLAPEIESRLKSEASRLGMDASDYASKLIAEHLPAAEDQADGDVESAPVRGVVPMEQPREELLTQPMSIRIDELPKWKPQVVLGRRVLGRRAALRQRGITASISARRS
jgi:hypothetical protein